METDHALLSRYARGRDADAFAELAQRYSGMVYGTALRIVGNPDDARELCRNVSCAWPRMFRASNRLCRPGCTTPRATSR